MIDHSGNHQLIKKKLIKWKIQMQILQLRNQNMTKICQKKQLEEKEKRLKAEKIKSKILLKIIQLLVKIDKIIKFHFCILFLLISQNYSFLNLYIYIYISNNFYRNIPSNNESSIAPKINPKTGKPEV